MKKILFIYNNFEEYFQYFIDEAKNLNVQLDLVHYNQISLDFIDETKVFASSIPIENYNLIYFRNAWRNTELSTLISAYCKHNKIPVIDPVFILNMPWIDRKSFEYLTLKNAHLPTIPSLFISKSKIDCIKKLSFPLIAKYTDTSQGRGVFLMKNKSQLDKLFKKTNRTHLLLQEFIKNNGDYRLFVIGKQVVAAIKRTAQSQNEFRNNVSLGGKSVKYSPSNKEKNIAIKATKTLNYSFAGVDLIKDEKGEFKIIEVNRSPQFLGVMETTGVNIPKKMIEYLISINH